MVAAEAPRRGNRQSQRTFSAARIACPPPACRHEAQGGVEGDGGHRCAGAGGSSENPQGGCAARNSAERAKMITSPGTMKQMPPISAPRRPRSRQAQKMASWVEAGPGSRLVAEMPSSNSWALSQPTFFDAEFAEQRDVGGRSAEADDPDAAPLAHDGGERHATVRRTRSWSASRSVRTVRRRLKTDNVAAQSGRFSAVPLRCRWRARSCGQAVTVERVPDPLAPPVALDEARLAENLHVVRDGRLALAEGLDELAHAHLALGRGRQDAEHPESDRVRQCAESGGQLGGIGGVEGRGQHRWAALRRASPSSCIACSLIGHHSPIDICRCIDDTPCIDR